MLAACFQDYHPQAKDCFSFLELFQMQPKCFSRKKLSHKISIKKACSWPFDIKSSNIFNVFPATIIMYVMHATYSHTCSPKHHKKLFFMSLLFQIPFHIKITSVFVAAAFFLCGTDDSFSFAAIFICFHFYAKFTLFLCALTVEVKAEEALCGLK